jgi:hypothetical protein
MKKLITVLNHEIPFGRALNASAHTVLGMGHRISEGKVPDIYVFMGTNTEMREFRRVANQIYANNTAAALYADFTSTMIGGTTEEQLLKTSITPESEMDYFAVSICADDAVLACLAPIISKLTLLPGYKPQLNTEAESEFDFLSAPILPDNHDQIYQQYATHKAALVFNKKQDIAKSINAMVTACLDVGKRAELMALHLLMYTNADGGKHPNISYHAFPIITAKNQGKLEALVTEVAENETLIFSAVNDHDAVLNVVCIFGDAAAVNIYTKQCSLWNREVIQEACVK